MPRTRLARDETCLRDVESTRENERPQGEGNSPQAKRNARPFQRSMDLNHHGVIRHHKSNAGGVCKGLDQFAAIGHVVDLHDRAGRPNRP